MISVSFTLYRFVCDRETFSDIFAIDAESRRIPDNSPFCCCWTAVPRQRAVAVGDAVEWCGCTPASYFKSHGSQVVLVFNSATGTIDIDGEASVITFNVKPYSNVNEPISVVAKGTLDPLPFIGKQSKNYAIRLRDAAGHVIGKLLFSLEVREDIAMERRLHRRKVECYNEPALTSPQRTSFGDTLGTDASGSACRVSNENSNASGRTDNNALRGTAFPNERRDRSFAYLGMEASRNERLPLGDHHVSGAVRTSPMNATSVQSNVRNKYVRLELGIQKIVLKSDSVEMENQASLLLGAVYQLKVHYGGNSSCTRSVTCQDTKRIVYADYMSFLEEMYDGEKLRFSLWEDDKQVAGFSLNPAKFRVPADTRKEYAVPFRYYPTRQMAFLEVTVQRTAMDNSFNDALAHESAKEALETLKKIQASSLAASKLNRERQERIRGLSERDQFTSPCQEHDVVANREEAWARADTGRLRVAAGDNIWQGKGRQMTSAKRCDDRAAGSNACGQRSEAGSDASFAVCSNRAGRHLFRNEGLTRVARRGESDKNSIETKTNAFSHAAGGDTSRSTSAQYQGTNDSSNGPMHCTGVNYSGCATTPLRSRIGLHGSAGGYRPYNDANVLDLVNDGGAEDSRASSRRRVLQRASPNRRIADRLVNSDDLGLNHLSPGRKRGGRCPGMGTSLMDEWLEWRLSRRSTYGSRAGSANSAFTGDDSVGSVYSHNHAASPRPTRSLANVAEMRPYTPLFTQQSFLSGRSRKR